MARYTNFLSKFRYDIQYKLNVSIHPVSSVSIRSSICMSLCVLVYLSMSLILSHSRDPRSNSLSLFMMSHDSRV